MFDHKKYKREWQHNYYHKHRTKIRLQDSVARRKNRRAKKARAVKEFGGKCTECGYDKCQAALEFHHKTPSKDNIQIGKIWFKAWPKIMQELKKCKLVCSNCHKEIHFEELD